MSVSITMAVATTTAMTQMEVTHVPAMMAISLAVMDTHVKVGKSYQVLINRIVHFWVKLS